MSRARILVVDDEALIRWSLARILGREGFEVDVASGREEALALAGSRPHDLIVADFEVCGPDEKSFLEALAGGRGRSLTIVLSATPRDQVEKALREFVPVRIMDKPFSSEEIIRAVKRALGALDEAPAPAPKRPSEGGET